MAGSFNDFLFRQDCTADGTLLARSLAVLGTSRVFGRNFYLGVASCVDITIHITVATDRTGMSGVASLGTGGRSYHSLIVMAGCLNCLLVGILAAGTLVCFITVYCTSRVYAAYYLMVMTKGRSHLSFTNRTGLGCGTGSFRAGSMAESGDGFSFRVTARSTGIGHQTCCSTGGFHGDNAFPIAVAGSRDYFLSNQYFVTHGAVLAFGQAGSGTGGLHGGIHHFGMAEGRDLHRLAAHVGRANRAVYDSLVAAFIGAVGFDPVLFNRSRSGMTECGNNFLSNNNLAAGRAMLALGQASSGTCSCYSGVNHFDMNTAAIYNPSAIHIIVGYSLGGFRYSRSVTSISVFQLCSSERNLIIGSCFLSQLIGYLFAIGGILHYGYSAFRTTNVSTTLSGVYRACGINRAFDLNFRIYKVGIGTSIASFICIGYG